MLLKKNISCAIPIGFTELVPTKINDPLIPIIERALVQKPGTYTVILISNISIRSIRCHIQKNMIEKDYVLDLKSWTIKSNKTTYAWNRTICKKDQGLIETIMTAYFIKNNDKWTAELTKSIKKIWPEFNEQNIEKHIKINASHLKIKQPSNGLFTYDRKNICINPPEQSSKNVSHNDAWAIEQLIQIKEKCLTNQYWDSQDSLLTTSPLTNPAKLTKLLLKLISAFTHKHPSNQDDPSVTAIVPNKTLKLNEEKIETMFTEILSSIDNPENNQIDIIRSGRLNIIDSELMSIGICREKKHTYKIRNDQGAIIESNEHTNNDFYIEKSIGNPSDRMNFRLLVDGAMSSSNKRYQHAKKISQYFNSAIGTNELITTVIPWLMEETTDGIENARQALIEMIQTQLNSNNTRDEFTFCMCIQINRAIHTFYLGDSHALIYTPKGTTYWLSLDRNTNSPYSSMETLNSSSHSTSALSIDSSNHDISYTANPDGIQPSKQFNLYHSIYTLSENAMLTMFSDGLGDLIIEKAGRRRGRTFTKIDLKSFQEIFKCANGSAQKTYKILMAFQNYLKEFKSDDLTCIVSKIETTPEEPDNIICHIGLSLSREELDETHHGD